MSKYVMCSDCGQVMNPGVGCKVERVRIDGIGYPRITYQPQSGDRGPDRKCHDCNAAPGQYHHTGCDMEVCPVCEGQLLSCGHEKDWTPYRLVPVEQQVTHSWHKTKLPIAGSNPAQGPGIYMVTARRYGATCVAIRKLKGRDLPKQPPGAWVVFYVPSGLGLATARTRAEAEQLALELEPILTPLDTQVRTAVAEIRDAYYHRCETEA